MIGLDVSASEVASLEGEELLDLCRRVALQMNHLQNLQSQIANQIWLTSEGSSSQDTLTKRYGCRSSVELIQRFTGESARVVSMRIRLGRQTAVRNSLLGEELPPEQEHVASALNSGYLNVEAADHISRVITKNAHASRVDDLEFAQRCLVQAATGLDFGTGDGTGMALHADDVRRLCVKWDEALDPDGAAPDDELRFRRRFLNVGSSKDGLAKITGLITSEVAAAFGAIADSLNNPRANADGQASAAKLDVAMVSNDDSTIDGFVPGGGSGIDGSGINEVGVGAKGEAGVALEDSGSALGLTQPMTAQPAKGVTTLWRLL
ncbi:MAG: DUF222 domain-containing protein [Scrofimicrobium sp.]